MENRRNLRDRLQDFHLSYVWLINMMKLKGYEIDKATVSSAIAGSITGPRRDKILSMGHEILDLYEDKWLNLVRV